MQIQKTKALGDFEIITTISDTKKSKVYLVSVGSREEGNQEDFSFAILKKHPGTDMVYCYRRIENLHSEYFPQIYQIWEENGETNVLEEYISGQTLQDIFEQSTCISENQVTMYMLEICHALHILHHADPPIIYRDLKPENVIVTDEGKIKLLDFDAVREYKENRDRDTVMLGTKEYASPEQFGFTQTDTRSDIYSWGIVFSELLSHAQVNVGYRRKAKKIVNRATMFDPEKRYQDTEALLKDMHLLKNHIHLVKTCVSMMALLFIGGICVAVWWKSAMPDFVITDRIGEAESSMALQESPILEAAAEQSLVSEQQPEIEKEETASLPDVYHYVSIEEDVKEKSEILLNQYPQLFGFSAFQDNDSGIYRAEEETIVGRDYVALRFLKSYPHDIIVCNDQLAGMRLDNIRYCRYLEEESRNDVWNYLKESDSARLFDNMISVSKDFLQQLIPGVYTFEMNMSSREGRFSQGFYLVVHDETEQVDNFRVHLINDVGYYVSEKQNDVFFYVNNTPYMIQEICIEERVLDENEYELVLDGFGVVFHAKLLEQYREQQAVEVVLTMKNGKRVGCRVINLDQFDF